MPFTTHTAQADAIGAAGSLEVFLEVVDNAEGETRGVCYITVSPQWDPRAARELSVPVAQLDTFHRALGLAIAEARRTGVLPPAGPALVKRGKGAKAS